MNIVAGNKSKPSNPDEQKCATKDRNNRMRRQRPLLSNSSLQKKTPYRFLPCTFRYFSTFCNAVTISASPTSFVGRAVFARCRRTSVPLENARGVATGPCGPVSAESPNKEDVLENNLAVQDRDDIRERCGEGIVVLCFVACGYAWNWRRVRLTSPSRWPRTASNLIPRNPN